MRRIKILDVGEKLIDEIWDCVSSASGFYSIGDGFSKEHLRKVFFESDIVVEVESGYARVELFDDFAEIHVLVFGPSFFAEAKENLQELYRECKGIFKNREIRCIIPSKMRGFKRLAKYAGMSFQGQCSRLLSGVAISCDVFTWRPENV